MLTIKVVDSIKCKSILNLLDEVDCKLAELVVTLYNNMVFALNHHVDYMVYWDLLTYKRILTYRLYNEDYASCPYTLDMIRSKVKLLIHK